MKGNRWMLGVAAIAMVTAAGAVAQTPAYYTGDGGRGITLVVYAPAGKGLSEEENWLLPLVQGTFNTVIGRYSAITVVDRQNLDTILAQQEESTAGEYSEEDYIRIGNLVNARHLLAGTITKTPNGSFMVEFSVSDVEDGRREASYGPAPCSAMALENLSAVKTAAVDLLGQLGVSLTAQGKAAITAAADTRQVEAEAALSKGIEAMKRGTVVEALSYFIQSSSIDPSLAEAASRVNIVSANISSGNMGEDARNEIAWRRAWVERLTECDRYVAEYRRNTPLATTLVYSTDLKRGTIDWNRETLSISGVDLWLRIADMGWPAPVQGVVDAVYAGLAGTGRDSAWNLNWPRSSAAGESAPVGWSEVKQYEVAVELVNDQEDVIGRETVRLSAGWSLGFSSGKTTASLSDSTASVTFPAVDTKKITDRLAIRIASLNGAEVESTARANRVSVMTKGDYRPMPPRNLRGEVSNNDIRLTWDAAGSGLKYRVQYAAQSSRGKVWTGEWKEVVTGTSLTMSGLRAEGAGYYLWVSPVFDGQEGGTSSSIKAGPLGYIVGDPGPAGGLVFYDKGFYSDGWRYLEAAPASAEFQDNWNNARSRCSSLNINGCTDWRLPAKGELDMLYKHLMVKGLGSFQRSLYWSSSEYDRDVAWGQNFSDGSSTAPRKTLRYLVRAVRAF